MNPMSTERFQWHEWTALDPRVSQSLHDDLIDEYERMRTAIRTVAERAIWDCEACQKDNWSCCATGCMKDYVKELLPFVDDSATVQLHPETDEQWDKDITHLRIQELDPWVGITPQMALRAAFRRVSEASHKYQLSQLQEELLHNPDRIRELAEEE